MPIIKPVSAEIWRSTASSIRKPYSVGDRFPDAKFRIVSSCALVCSPTALALRIVQLHRSQTIVSSSCHNSVVPMPNFQAGGRKRLQLFCSNNFTCSWYLVFVPQLSVANVIFSRLIKVQAGKKSIKKSVEPRPKLPEPRFCTNNSHQFCRDEAGSFWQHSAFPLHFHSNTAVP